MLEYCVAQFHLSNPRREENLIKNLNYFHGVSFYSFHFMA